MDRINEIIRLTVDEFYDRIKVDSSEFDRSIIWLNLQSEINDYISAAYFDYDIENGLEGE